MAASLRHALAFLRVPGNALRFRLRSTRRRAASAVILSGEDKSFLFAHLDAGARAAADGREAAMRGRYDLGRLRGAVSNLVYADNLAVLAMCEALLDDCELPPREGPLVVADVGAGDFRYATGLQRYLRDRSGARGVDLCGVEVDGYGVYRDGHARADLARAHAALAGPGVRYEVGDFATASRGSQHVVTMLFPFVSRYALLRWGLPLSLFAPRALLAKAAAVLLPGGFLAVANQTGGEAAKLQELMAGLPLRCVRQAGLACDLVPYAARTAERRGSVWQRL
jgi:SAM-dependent methyltransferase